MGCIQHTLHRPDPNVSLPAGMRSLVRRLRRQRCLRSVGRSANGIRIHKQGRTGDARGFAGVGGPGPAEWSGPSSKLHGSSRRAAPLPASAPRHCSCRKQPVSGYSAAIRRTGRGRPELIWHRRRTKNDRVRFPNARPPSLPVANESHPRPDGLALWGGKFIIQGQFFSAIRSLRRDRWHATVRVNCLLLRPTNAEILLVVQSDALDHHRVGHRARARVGPLD